MFSTLPKAQNSLFGCHDNRHTKACAGKGFGKPVEKPAPQSTPKPEQRGMKLKIPSKIAPVVKREDLADKLGSISVVFVGDDTELNAAAARTFAKCAGYTPMSTASIIQQYTGQSCEELEASEGLDAVVATEVSALEQLGAIVRCSIGTLGGGTGAAARGDVWRHLFGAYTVWLDTKPGEDAASAPQRDAYSQAEVHVVIGDATASHSAGAAGTAGTAEASSSDDDVVESVISQVLPGLVNLLKEDPSLPQGKLMYIKLGCRGDWPNVMPPEWNPDAPAPAGAAADA